MKLAHSAIALGLVFSPLGCDSDTGDKLPAGYDHVIAPSSNDHEAIQTVMINAQSGDVIGLRPGTYRITRELNLTGIADVTLKGMGDTRDEVIIDFADQTEGDDGITVTAGGFTIENLWIKNSPGNGVVAHSEDSTFRNIKVSWDAGSVTGNGFYAVYPNDCKRTVIEDVEVTGASDAGLYVGSCEYAIVRRNKVHANVAGIELENSTSADVYDNEVYDNSAGILALLLPNQPRKENTRILFRNNEVRDNNRPNFATAGTVVASVPTGTGVLVLCGTDIEVRDNAITGNDSGGVIIVSYGIFELLTGTTLDDPELDPFVKRVYVHGNTFSGNGTAPKGGMAVVGVAPLEDVLWDGLLEDGQTDAQICLGATPAAFRNFAASDNFALDKQSTSTVGHTCTLPVMPAMETFPQVAP
jgi:parallel beta-helix repeat protein